MDRFKLVIGEKLKSFHTKNKKILLRNRWISENHYHKVSSFALMEHLAAFFYFILGCVFSKFTPSAFGYFLLGIV